jgi:hypothetical protein
MTFSFAVSAVEMVTKQQNVDSTPKGATLPASVV